jgi:UDP-GlcNAc:undecaprenyl-phosphate GlcNAc-1-phosphate transferase
MSQIWLWLSTHANNALGGLLAAFLVALGLTPVVIQVARRRGLVARPNAERWHKAPTALYGGVAIFFAALIAALLFLPEKRPFLAVGVGATFIFVVGVWDDLRPLRPAHKFVAQLIAACAFTAIYYGTDIPGAGRPPTYMWLMPLAIVWIVGITNAFNLLDNMDGLSAGVATCVATLMALHAAVVGDSNVAFGALIIAGAASGFLIYNFNPAKIFMGDCGSMFLGFSLSCLTLMGSNRLLSGNLFTALVLPTLALATPLFDTIFVSVVRFLNGRPISQGGRDHTSHRLVLLGLSERRAVCYLYGITLWFGAIALWGAMVKDPASDIPWATITITLLSAIALLIFALFLAEVQTYSEEEYEKARHKRHAQGGKTVLSRVTMHKRRFVEAFLDFGLICACLIGAFLLQYEGNLEGHQRSLAIAVPYVIACQMAAFYWVGLYRGLWRYVTISDIGAAVRGVFWGTLSAGVLIAFVAPYKSAAETLIIYAVLLIVAICGMRLGLKALRYHFALKWRDGLRRVLVVGAGDAGELAVREMFNNQALQLQPVGFLDDDPSKQQAKIHGIQVLGTRGNLLDVVRKFNVDEVIIAMPSIGNGAVQEVVDACRENDIDFREVRGVIL